MTKTVKEILTEMAEGLEIAATAEQHVMNGFQSQIDLFHKERSSKEQTANMRAVRIYCDARNNKERFLREATALREALIAVEQNNLIPPRPPVVVSDAVLDAWVAEYNGGGPSRGRSVAALRKAITAYLDEQENH